MQMFWLEAEGALQCTTLLWQEQQSVHNPCWHLPGAVGLAHCLNLHALLSLSPSLTGDNYPVQFIPSTMAAAAASGLSPLQLQVCAVL